MAITKTAPRTWQPKTNNYTVILNQFLKKYNFSAELTLEQLSEHASELDASLLNWIAHKCVKVAFTKSKCWFSKEKIKILMLDQRKKKLIIEEKAKYYAKTSDKWDIFIHTRDIGSKSNDDKEIVTSCSWLSLFHNELIKADIAPELIDIYAKDSNVITVSNKIQKK